MKTTFIFFLVAALAMLAVFQQSVDAQETAVDPIPEDIAIRGQNNPAEGSEDIAVEEPVRGNGKGQGKGRGHGKGHGKGQDKEKRGGKGKGQGKGQEKGQGKGKGNKGGKGNKSSGSSEEN
ncbi:sperm protamine P1-like [Uranotaenia lowii]|uniref:sperm protamine P1-like n=1 Tax=Uranotaenia lowii TaxID=190385 RepID=UPI002479D911|nr:sperm protamine P1-like [Uranotaenia lowii]